MKRAAGFLLRSPWPSLVLPFLGLLFPFRHLLLLVLGLVFLTTFISHACSLSAIMTREAAAQRESQTLSRIEADNRHELPVEFREPIWSKLLYSPQHSRGIFQEHLDIDALTPR